MLWLLAMLQMGYLYVCRADDHDAFVFGTKSRAQLFKFHTWAALSRDGLQPIHDMICCTAPIRPVPTSHLRGGFQARNVVI